MVFNGCRSTDVSANVKFGSRAVKNFILMIIHSRDEVNLDRVSKKMRERNNRFSSKIKEEEITQEV